MEILPRVTALILELKGDVLTVWFNRPEMKNALSSNMVDELGLVLDAVRDERSIRAIVVRGKGGTFCAGGDLKSAKFDVQMNAATLEEVAKTNRVFGNLMIKINEQPQVVIMMVEGAAIGGGFGLACVGDITIVASNAKFRLSETSLGIPPAQIAPFLTERVGLTQARRRMLTGARFGGEEAVALGIGHILATDTLDLEKQCTRVLDQIKLCAPEANAATKAIVFESMRMPRAECLDFASKHFAACMLGEEGREGVTAFVEKRLPSWANG